MHRHLVSQVPWAVPAASCLVACWMIGNPSPGLAGTGNASVCRSDKVEFIIGGLPQADCTGRQRLPEATEVRLGGSKAATRMTVSSVEQHQRDQDRRAILEQELQHEQLQLADQLRPGSGADSAMLNRTRSNVLALQRELGRIGP